MNYHKYFLANPKVWENLYSQKYRGEENTPCKICGASATTYFFVAKNKQRQLKTYLVFLHQNKLSFSFSKENRKRFADWNQSDYPMFYFWGGKQHCLEEIPQWEEKLELLFEKLQKNLPLFEKEILKYNIKK